jgi:hypothetical protein
MAGIQFINMIPDLICGISILPGIGDEEVGHGGLIVLVVKDTELPCQKGSVE